MRYALIFTATIAVLSANAIAQTHNTSTMDMQLQKIQHGDAKMDMPPTVAANLLPVARDGEVIDSVGSGAIEAILPVEQTINGITYITGGVSDEELTYLKTHQNEYNVRLLISAASGEYMSETKLRFIDQSGKEVLNAENVGPYFYANVPQGSYTVESTSMHNQVKSIKLAVDGKPTKGNISIRF